MKCYMDQPYSFVHIQGTTKCNVAQLYSFVHIQGIMKCNMDQPYSFVHIQGIMKCNVDQSYSIVYIQDIMKCNVDQSYSIVYIQDIMKCNVDQSYSTLYTSRALTKSEHQESMGSWSAIMCIPFQNWGFLKFKSFTSLLLVMLNYCTSGRLNRRQWIIICQCFQFFFDTDISHKF